MKKIISLLLSLVILVTCFSVSTTALAASKPAKVKGVTATTIIDRYNQTVTFKVKWKKVKGVSGYQVKAGLDADYGGERYRELYTTATLKGAKSTTLKLKDEYNASLVYNIAKVRAYKKVKGKKIYGKWSKLVFTKKKVINQVTGLKGKVVDTHHSAKKLKLTWDKFKGADGYRIVYTQWSDYEDVRTIDVKGTSYTGWMGNVGIVQIKWYKIVNGEKHYSDCSDIYLDYSPDAAG